MDKVKSFASQLTGRSGLAALEKKNPDDVVITMAIRSPLCKARKGGLKDARSVCSTPRNTSILIILIRSDELLTEMFRHSIAHSGINPTLIQDICVGNVLTPAPTFEARAAALAAGIPETTPVQVVNRFCSSGLMAVTIISNQIRAGQIEVGLAIGADSMSAQ